MKTNLLQKNIPKDWSVKKIKDLLKFEQPTKYIVERSSYASNGKTPVLTANKSFVLGYTNETNGVYTDTPAIIFDDFTTDSKYVDFPFKIKSSAIKILKSKDENTDLKFVYEIMKSFAFPIANHKRHYISQYQELDIVIPPIKEQKKIAEILSSVDKEIQKVEEIISKTEKFKKGLMQDFLKNNKNLKFFDLESLCLSITAGGDLPDNYNKEQKNPTEEFPYPIYSNGIEDKALYGFTNNYKIENSAITISARGTIGYHVIRKAKFTPIIRLITLIPNEEIVSIYYLNYVLDNVKINYSSSGIPQLTVPNVKKLKIPVVSIIEQKKLSNTVLSVDKKILISKNLRENLILLKKGLVSDLLSGNKRVKI